MLAIGCVAVSTVGAVTVKAVDHEQPAAAAVAAPGDDAFPDDRTGQDRATRDRARASAPPAIGIEAVPSTSPSPAPSSPAAPRPLRPVKGLNQRQMNNAAAIVAAGRKLDLPRRAHLVALVTALQESGLRNLANPKVPASMNRAHEGAETNFDSLGLFQQRPSQGWGTTDQLMSPAEASRLFYLRLQKVPGWESMTVNDAAQAVQRSAFPDAYAKHQARAEQIVDALS
jgi:hypothetical protein